MQRKSSDHAQNWVNTEIESETSYTGIRHFRHILILCSSSLSLSLLFSRFLVFSLSLSLSFALPFSVDSIPLCVCLSFFLHWLPFSFSYSVLLSVSLYFSSSLSSSVCSLSLSLSAPLSPLVFVFVLIDVTWNPGRWWENERRPKPKQALCKVQSIRILWNRFHDAAAKGSEKTQRSNLDKQMYPMTEECFVLSAWNWRNGNGFLTVSAVTIFPGNPDSVAQKTKNAARCSWKTKAILSGSTFAHVTPGVKMWNLEIYRDQSVLFCEFASTKSAHFPSNRLFFLLFLSRKVWGELYIRCGNEKASSWIKRSFLSFVAKRVLCTRRTAFLSLGGLNLVLPPARWETNQPTGTSRVQRPSHLLLTQTGGVSHGFGAATLLGRFVGLGLSEIFS